METVWILSWTAAPAAPVAAAWTCSTVATWDCESAPEALALVIVWSCLTLTSCR